jgi:hypothetical protein
LGTKSGGLKPYTPRCSHPSIPQQAFQAILFHNRRESSAFFTTVGQTFLFAFAFFTTGGQTFLFALGRSAILADKNVCPTERCGGFLPE